MSLKHIFLALLFNGAVFAAALLLAKRFLVRGCMIDRLFLAAAIGWSSLIVGLEVLSTMGALRLGPAAVMVGLFVVIAAQIARAQRRRPTITPSPLVGEGRGEGAEAEKKRDVILGRPLCRQPAASQREPQGAGRESSSLTHAGLPAHVAARRINDLDQPRRQRSGRLRNLPAALALLLGFVAGGYQLLRGLWLPVETISDAPIYHLYFAVRWWQEGHVSMVATPFGETAATYFPANGALWYCWLVMLTESELLAKVGQWPFWLLAGAAIFALSRQLGAGRAAAVFPTVLWATCTSVLLQGAGLANVDLIFTAWFLVACYFLVRSLSISRSLRALHTPDSSAEMGSRTAAALFLGFALAAGAALGTHALGLFVLPLLLLPALGWLITQPRRGRLLLMLLLAGVMPCAYWYGRNWGLTGNPLYPLHVELFARTLFWGWYERAAMLQSSYHLPTDHLNLLAQRIDAVIDLRLSSLLLAAPAAADGTGAARVAWAAFALAHLFCWPLAILAGFFLMRRRTWPPDGTPSEAGRWLGPALSFLSLLYLAIFWWVVPYQSQQRFLFPAAALAIVPFAAVVNARPSLQLGTVALLVGHLLLPLTPGGAFPGLAPPPHVWEVPPGHFYPTWDFGANFVRAWEVLEHYAPSGGARIAYAGTNLPYYLFGPALRNRVDYVNVTAPPEFLLHDVHRQRLDAGNTQRATDPWPNWFREHPSYEAWLENLSRRDIDLLFIAQENQHGRRVPTRATFPIEQQWASSHPEHFELLWKDPWVSVFRRKAASR